MPLAYKCYEGTAPEYLQELIPRYVHARPLLSSSQPRLLIPSAAKNTLKAVWFPNLFQLCFQDLECSTTNSQGSKHLGGVSQTSENICSVNDFLPCVFFFLFMTFSLSSSPPPPPPHGCSTGLKSGALAAHIPALSVESRSVPAVVSTSRLLLIFNLWAAECTRCFLYFK